MSSKTKQKYLVLIADDSEEDSFLLERALRQSTLFEVIGSVRNGAETVAYLAGAGLYADRQLWPMPDVLLMDLKMPRVSGTEVLEWLQREKLPGLKVAVLSGSSVADDVQAVKRLGADAFYTKSASHSELARLVRNLEELLLNSPCNGELPPGPQK